jgi:hypothetical protein
VTPTETTLTRPCRQKPRFLPAVRVGTGPDSAESAAGDFRPRQSRAVLHGYRYSLLWRAREPAMLAPYAHNSVYLPILLIGLRQHGRRSGDSVQMGRRGWGGALQRSAPRECSKGGAEGAPDLFLSKNLRAGAVLPEYSSAQVVGSGVSELLGLRAGERAGFLEHGHRDRRCNGSTGRAAGRYRGCDARRITCPRSAGDRRAVHDLTRRPGHTHYSNGGQGSRWHYGVLVGARDFLRSTTFVTVADQSRQTTLTVLRSRRSRVRRGS